MTGPAEPKITPLEVADGTEMIRCRKGGRWSWLPSALLRGLKGDKGDPGKDSTVAGPKGDPGPPKRIQAFTSSASNASGVGKVVFTPAFAAPPVVQAGVAWTGSQIIQTIPKNVTAQGCEVTVVRSRGSLVGTNSPFETVAGLTGSVTAFGE